jgi:hypothetical protein
MKTIYQTYPWIVIILITVFFSCTNDLDDKVLMLKQIVEVSSDGTLNTSVITYNGNKISSIDSDTKRSDFIYTNNLITKIEEVNKGNNQLTTLQFSYTNTNLVKITSSENYVMNYIHNNDGTISYEKLTKNSNNTDVRVFHGTLFFLSTNLKKDEMIMDNTEANVISKNVVSLEYDIKRNALRNILSFDKLLNYNKSISLNNIVNSTEENEINNTNTNQITSSITSYKSVNKYNTDGYPTEILSEKLFLGNGGGTNHLKTLLLYN